MFENGRTLFQSPFGDGRFLTVDLSRAELIAANRPVEGFQSPFGDGRFLTRTVTAMGLRPNSCSGFNPLSEMAAF